MANKMEMSLDDIIKTSRSVKVQRGGGPTPRGRGSSSAPYRSDRQPYQHGGSRGHRGGIQKPSYHRSEASKHYGPRSDSYTYTGPKREEGVYQIPTLGGSTKLLISNLDFGVTDSDIYELFVEFGALKKASLHYDRAGRSLGTADVIYERRTDAMKAMKQYNGVALDGKRMSIQLASSEGRAPVHQDPYASGSSRPRAPYGSSFRGRDTGGFTRGSATQIRGRGAGGSTHGNGSRRQATKPTAEDLDAEMDAYLNERKNQETLPANPEEKEITDDKILGVETPVEEAALPEGSTRKEQAALPEGKTHKEKVPEVKTPAEEAALPEVKIPAEEAAKEVKTPNDNAALPEAGITDEEAALLDGEIVDDEAGFLEVETSYEDDSI